MFRCPRLLSSSVLIVGLLGSAISAEAQQAQQPQPSPWVIDAGIGFDVPVNGNVNSGAIGTLQGQTAAVLPNPYGAVYGTGVHLRFGGGYLLNEQSELRTFFTLQTADADLVRLGDVGPSSLYGQYSDYTTFSLDFGYRRYLPLSDARFRPYGEATIGVAFIDEINVLFAAPQSNIVFDDTDFYDRTAAFTLGIHVGVLFPVREQLGVNVQVGLRRVSGLAEASGLAGTGIEEINSDSARLTFPVVVGVRYRF